MTVPFGYQPLAGQSLFSPLNGVPQMQGASGINPEALNYGMKSWQNMPTQASIDTNLAGLDQNNGSWMDAAFGNSKTGQQGWAMPAIQGFTGLAGAYLGMKQYGLAKDAFKESKRQFQTNFDAQAQTTNRQIKNDYAKGQAAARVSGVGGSDLSQAEYMAQWGVGNKDNRNGTGV